jgi:hypothetical protein
MAEAVGRYRQVVRRGRLNGPSPLRLHRHNHRSPDSGTILAVCHRDAFPQSKYIQVKLLLTRRLIINTSSTIMSNPEQPLESIQNRVDVLADKDVDSVDSDVRYLAYGARIRTALRASTRYIAYVRVTNQRWSPEIDNCHRPAM